MSTVEKVVYLEKTLARACARKDWPVVDRLRVAIRLAQVQAERVQKSGGR